MTDINILNNGIDMIKLFSDKEGFKEQGKNFNDKNKNNIINNFINIDKIMNNKLSNKNEIQNLTNPPIIYKTNRIELNNYSDMLL